MYPRTVYIAGPYTSLNADGTMNLDGVRKNITIAKYWGRVVARLGGMPFIPHTNTDETFLDVQNADFWYRGTMRMCEAADGVLMLRGWKASAGARRERERAQQLSKPIFSVSDSQVLDELDAWLKKP